MPANIIETFYDAFSKRDWKTMQNCYHPEATFSDSVFVNLNAQEVKAMWQMLVSSAKDIEIVYKDVQINGSDASANWIATYTFSVTKRKVVNDILANFELKDGLIYRHRDHFGFYKWASKAFGMTGILLGWTPFFKNKIRKVSREKLQAFMQKTSS